jgi:hypothetical protein
MMEQTTVTAAESTEVSVRRRPARWLLPVALLAFVLALVAASQIIGVLYGMINPPLPPLPPDVTQQAHSSEVYGVDAWAYRAALLPQELHLFYVTSGASCTTAPFPPTESEALYQQFPDAGMLYAVCEGEIPFSRFAMRWRALISVYQPGEADTRLDLVRQIDWFGSSDG